MFAEDEARLLAAEAESEPALANMVARRTAGEPLEQVLGWAEFCGLRIALEPCVFVPRPRTEFLARQAAGLATPGAVVVDLCCGSGALGAAVGAIASDIELHAADIDPVATRCATRNVGEQACVYEGDLYDALPASLRGRVDVLVANVPYVPAAEIALMPREAREHEPRAALDGGADGLDVARQVISGAPPWLVRGGTLLFETSEEQAPAAMEALAQAGLSGQTTRSEELEATVVSGRRS